MTQKIKRMDQNISYYNLISYVKKLGSCGLAQWWSNCLACVRPHIPSPASQRKKNHFVLSPPPAWATWVMADKTEVRLDTCCATGLAFFLVLQPRNHEESLFQESAAPSAWPHRDTRSRPESNPSRSPTWLTRPEAAPPAEPGLDLSSLANCGHVGERSWL